MAMTNYVALTSFVANTEIRVHTLVTSCPEGEVVAYFAQYMHDLLVSIDGNVAIAMMDKNPRKNGWQLVTVLGGGNKVTSVYRVTDTEMHQLLTRDPKDSRGRCFFLKISNRNRNRNETSNDLGDPEGV